MVQALGQSWDRQGSSELGGKGEVMDEEILGTESCAHG